MEQNTTIDKLRKVEVLLNSFCTSPEFDETVKNQIPKYRHEHVEAVPVVSLLKNQNIKGVVIQYDEDRVSDETFKEEETTNLSKLDVTGSPLHNPIDRNLLKFPEDTIMKSFCKEAKTQYKPVSLDTARLLLSKYNLNLQAAERHPSLWILCDGTKEDIILLGSHISKNISLRTIVKQIGSSGKTYNDHINIEDIKNSHLFGVSHDKCDISVSSLYSLSINTGELDELNRAVLNFQWKKCNEIFEKPPLDAACYLELKVKLTSSSNYMSKQYEELQLLETISKRASWDNEKYPHNSLLLRKVRDILKAENQRKVSINVLSSACRYKEYVIKPECVKLSSIIRDELDFTDLAWLLLKDFSCLEELVECLKFIFQALQEKNIIPMIYKSNTTQMAKIISSHKYPSVLDKMFALQLLIEMGIEKLLRDYMHFFQANKLLTKDQLISLRGQKRSVSECLDYLKRLHYCVELIQVFTLHLKLGEDHVQMFSRQIVQFYVERKNKIDEHVMQYPLQTSLVSAMISENQCTSWCMKMFSKDGTYKKETLFYASPSNPCPWISLKQKLYYIMMMQVEDKAIGLLSRK